LHCFGASATVQQTANSAHCGPVRALSRSRSRSPSPSRCLCGALITSVVQNADMLYHGAGYCRPNDMGKDVVHLWELGGGTNAIELIGTVFSPLTHPSLHVQSGLPRTDGCFGGLGQELTRSHTHEGLTHTHTHTHIHTHTRFLCQLAGSHGKDDRKHLSCGGD
jgi:hypothetical protein